MVPNLSSYTVVVIIALMLFCAYGCEEDDELVAIRSIETIEPYVSGEAVISGGIIKANRDISLVRYGVCLNTESNPTVEDTVIVGENLRKSPDGGGYFIEFESVMVLSPGTQYYIRAFIETRSGLAYGNETDFIFN